MKKTSLFIVLSLILFASSKAQEIQYIDASTLTLYGKAHPSGPHYHRVDTARYRDMPRSVKSLSTHAAGLVIAFKTNAREIHARWRVKDPVRFYDNMTEIASRGLDLYIKRDGQWTFAGVGRCSNGPVSERRIVGNMAEGEKECLLYLPMYDELISLEIGTEKGSTVSPLEIPWKGKVVIYGSSITQGASASRPGMAYPAQLQRHLGYEVVNLGYSGSGKMEASVAHMIADIEGVDLFVLDCAANPSPAEIEERTENFVRLIREKHPQVPMLMIERTNSEAGNFDTESRQRVIDQNKNFRAAYQRLVKSGMRQLSLIPGDGLLGHDHEATTDGVHPNDIGFERMVNVIEPRIRKVLK